MAFSWSDSRRRPIQTKWRWSGIMVRHQAIDRAEKPFARGGVKHHFPKRGVKRRSQPATGAGFQCVGPEHDGMALIVMPQEARQVPFAFEGHAACISPRCDGVKRGLRSRRQPPP